MSSILLPVCYFKKLVIIFPDISSVRGILSQRVNSRLQEAYRPKTSSAYNSMFVTYLAFCEFIAADFLSPDISIWLTFIEFLVFNGLKSASINNYISAIKTLFKWFNLNMEIFDHPKLKHMLRAVEVSVHRPAI